MTVTPVTRSSVQHTSAIRSASRSSNWYRSERTTRLIGLGNRRVVDGVLQRVRRAGLREVDGQLDVDLERLRSRLLLGEDAVHAELPKARNEDPVHAESLRSCPTARRGERAPR